MQQVLLRLGRADQRPDQLEEPIGRLQLEGNYIKGIIRKVIRVYQSVYRFIWPRAKFSNVKCDFIFARYTNSACKIDSFLTTPTGRKKDELIGDSVL